MTQLTVLLTYLSLDRTKSTTLSNFLGRTNGKTVVPTVKETGFDLPFSLRTPEVTDRHGEGDPLPRFPLLSSTLPSTTEGAPTCL